MVSLMLVGAVFASLALGVLAAYGVCQGFFRVMRMHAESTAKARAPIATVTVISKS